MSLHAFAICGYKDSDYLAELIDSLRAQTVLSEIFIATSTPTERMRGIAARYDLPLHVNPVPAGISADWNFALSRADAEYVTLAHQDDFYEPDFTKKTLEAFSRAKNPVFAYTNYFEIRPEGRVFSNKLLRVKRVMNAPIRVFPRSRFVRNRVLAMGCPVSCPSVTFNMKRFPEFRFSAAYKNDLDWEAWSRLAREQGELLYIKTPLLGHRIHAESETTNSISSGVRSREDLEMFMKYWPAPIARLIHRFYENGMKSNEV